jgi:hypothetical protein
MIFIVESGSTKSDWVLIDDKNNQSFYSTMGFNPYFHSSDVIESELKKNWFINKDIKSKEEQLLINTLYKCFDSI